MTAATTNTGPLRLVRPPVGAPGLPRCVASLTQPAAPALTPTDPRWVLAVRVAYTIQGGRAAILRPADRRHLHRLAAYLGLRPFDANLVIAIVQDAARSGDAASARVRLGPEVADRLAMLASAEPKPDIERNASPILLLLASGTLATLLVAAASRWLGA